MSAIGSPGKATMSASLPASSGERQGGQACAIEPGVIGSWDGLILAPAAAEIPVGVDACVPSPGIPYGRYRFVAWRGIEYERAEGRVDLSAHRGRVALDIALERAWTPHGTLAADMHVHAFASNDSRIPTPQRVIAQAAAGIQVIGLSDHNSNGDVEADIIQLGLTSVIASVPSDELTSEQLHVGVYPVPVARDQPYGGGPGDTDDVIKGDAQRLFEIAHAMPGHPIVQVNHPRFRVTALFDNTGWDGVSWPPPFPLGFDAVEVLNGFTAFNVRGDRRFDEGARDFYTFVDHGRLIAPLGNSDTHDFNWVLDGTNRSYVFVDDARTQPFDQGAFITAIRSRRIVATSGPWLDVEAAPARGATPTVGPGEALHARGSVWLDITVSQARFVRATRLRITVGRPSGPTLARLIDIPRGRHFHWTGAVEVGTSDTWVGVIADGDTPLPLEQTGSYQKDKWNRPGVTPFAFASPILIDADGDHRWTRNEANLPLP
ncbi:MAG TPA: CehA/McbA family metallohydrolase [Kofleriaceae bacterium]|nr:CehA/McbA family metallohydrolase [Kofleriaceae bacterium]